MIRRPPRSTRTEHTLSLHDALPISGSFKMGLSIQSDGLVQPSDQAVTPNVTLTIPADQLAELPGVLRARDPALLTELLHVEGDAGLAQVVSELARDLRWEIGRAHV